MQTYMTSMSMGSTACDILNHFLQELVLEDSYDVVDSLL